MIYLVQDFQLLQRDGVNLIQRIQAGNILPVALYDVNDVVFSRITLQTDIGVVYFVLFQDGLNYIVRQSVGLARS